MLSSALAVAALLTPVWSQYFENGSEFCDSDHDDDTLPACGCQNRWQLLHVLTDQKIAEKPAVELGEADGILAVVNCISECCKRDSCYAFLYTEQEKRGVKTFTCGLFDEKEGVPGITEAEGRTIQQDVGKKYVKYEYTQKLPSDYSASWDSCKAVGEDTCMFNMRAHMYPHAFFADGCVVDPETGEYDVEGTFEFDEFVVPFGRCFQAFGHNSVITCLPDGPNGDRPGVNMIHWVKFSTVDCQPGTETVIIDHENGSSCHPGLVPANFFVKWDGWCSKMTPPDAVDGPDGSGDNGEDPNAGAGDNEDPDAGAGDNEDPDAGADAGDEGDSPDDEPEIDQNTAECPLVTNRRICRERLDCVYNDACEYVPGPAGVDQMTAPCPDVTDRKICKERTECDWNNVCMDMAPAPSGPDFASFKMSQNEWDRLDERCQKKDTERKCDLLVESGCVYDTVWLKCVASPDIQVTEVSVPSGGSGDGGKTPLFSSVDEYKKYVKETVNNEDGKEAQEDKCVDLGSKWNPDKKKCIISKKPKCGRVKDKDFCIEMGCKYKSKKDKCAGKPPFMKM